MKLCDFCLKTLESPWCGVQAGIFVTLTSCSLRAGWKVSNPQGVEALLIGWNSGCAQAFPVCVGAVIELKDLSAASCFRFFQALLHKVTACCHLSDAFFFSFANSLRCPKLQTDILDSPECLGADLPRVSSQMMQLPQVKPVQALTHSWSHSESQCFKAVILCQFGEPYS